MANKKSDGNSIVGLILVVLLFLFFSGPLLVPCLFFILFFVQRIWYKSTVKPIHLQRRFWLDDAEKERFIKNYNELDQALNLRQSASSAAERECIHVNKNGRLSARSYRGQELQRMLDHANAIINETSPIHEELKNRPRSSWKKAKRHYSQAIGYGWSTFFWCVYILIATGGRLKAKLGPYIDNMSSIFGGSGKDLDTGSMKLLWIGLGILLLVYLVAWATAGAKFEEKNPAPPEVTMDNVLSFMK